MSTNFGAKIAITGFVRTIATALLVVEVWLIEWLANNMQILPIHCN